MQLSSLSFLSNETNESLLFDLQLTLISTSKESLGGRCWRLLHLCCGSVELLELSMKATLQKSKAENNDVVGTVISSASVAAVGI